MENDGTLTNTAAGTFKFTSSGTDTDVTIQAVDSSGAANLVIDTTGAGSITIGSGDVTSFTVTTDGTGTGEVVLPDESIGTAEIADTAVTSAKLSTAAKTHIAVVRIGGLAGSDDRYLMVAPSAGAVVQISIVSDTATSGSDGTNNWTMQVRNLTQGKDLLATAATTNGNEIAADTVWDLGPDQNLTLAANDVLELQVTKNGSPTDLSSAEILAQIEYTTSN